ncbi:MAG: hypothetical protein EPO28_10470 [Saprospiraceae bacterium]|nr:MAG: hypothetical protein EPO28_10470 [Saprospiraceae bacterium]
MQKFLPIVFQFYVSFLNAQIPPASTVSQTIGGAGVASSGINSLFENQAGLTGLKGLGVIAAASQPFTLNELNSAAMGLAIPFSLGVFGLRLHSFGFQEFRQNGAGLSYARNLGERLSLGAQFDYWNLRIPEYGSDGVVSFEIGIQAALTKKLTLGTHIINPLKIAWSDGSELPAVFKLGATWQPSAKSELRAELEKDVDYPMRIMGGVAYHVAGPVILRLGAGTNPATLTMGLGVILDSGTGIEAGMVFHQSLGATPGFGASYVRQGEGD